ncbi:MAG: tyrosine-type recombinase/integrase [Oscillospiraceae bacterium]|nr:tyrosine-type recombinase/integrase [Oscillospiraceae bacterium]
MTEYVSKYEQYLLDCKNVAKNTLDSYIGDIKIFLAFIENKGDGLFDSCEDDVKKFISYLETQGKSLATISRNVSSLRAFFQFMQLNDYISENPLFGIRIGKSEKKLPYILPPQDVDALLRAPDESAPKGCRDKAMLGVLYATGIRVSEMLDLNLEDVNWELKTIKCVSRRAERILPIYQDALRMLKKYVKRARAEMLSGGLEERALFLNMSGSRMTRQGFWKIVKFYAGEAHIEGAITPHTLRHSFAAHLLANGAELKDIKEILGLTDLSSAQVYVDILKSRFQDIYNKCHPRA